MTRPAKLCFKNARTITLPGNQHLTTTEGENQ